MPCHPDRVRRNYQPTIYWCSVCGETFSSEQELNEHTELYNNDPEEWDKEIKRNILEKYSE